MRSGLPTVFVVDDDPSVRRAMARLIRSMGMTVEVFASAESFLARAPYDGEGCIVLDIRMPGMTGLELQEHLAGAAYSMPVVLLTGHGDVPASVRAMKLGAVDFLQKPVAAATLARAIEEALARDRQHRRAYQEAHGSASLVARLTAREREVIELVVRGMLNKQIGAALGIAEKTVKVHRGRALAKLHVKSVADLVRVWQKAEQIAHAPPTRPNRRRRTKVPYTARLSAR